MENLKKAIVTVNDRVFNVRTTASGDNIIVPRERKQLRNDIRTALKDDINGSLTPEMGEAFINEDNLMLVFYNKADQFVVVELDVKVKNLDYNPYDE